MNWLLKIGLATLSALVMWASMEVGFRLVPNHYSLLVRPGEECAARGQWHRAGSCSWIGNALQPRRSPANVVRWNSRGWHDVEHTVEKPPGVTRVLVVGDSFVEAVQVPLEDTFYRRLEQDLAAKLGRPFEVVAMGWSGWGQIQELLALDKEGLAYAPDLVVMEFLGINDVRNNDDDLERLANEEAAAGSAGHRCFVSALRHGLFFTAFVCDRVDGVLRGLSGTPDPLDYDVYRAAARRSEEWAEAWKRTEFAVDVMSKLSREHRAAFMVAAFSNTIEVSDWAQAPDRPDLDGRLPTDRMAAICARAGIPFLNLSRRFAELPAAGRVGINLADDGHWTSYGHSLAAGEIGRFLISHQLIESAPAVNGLRSVALTESAPQ